MYTFFYWLVYLWFYSLKIPLFFLNSVFLSLFSPSIGDGPYSRPEAAALHHSQCKFSCSLLSLSLSLFRFMPQHPRDIRKEIDTCHIFICLTLLVIIYCACCLTPVPFSLFHYLPCVSSHFFFSHLTVWSSKFTSKSSYSPSLSPTAFLLNPCLVSLTPKTALSPSTSIWRSNTSALFSVFRSSNPPPSSPFLLLLHTFSERDPEPHSHQRRDGPPIVRPAGAHLQPAGGPHDDQDGSPGPGGGLWMQTGMKGWDHHHLQSNFICIKKNDNQQRELIYCITSYRITLYKYIWLHKNIGLHSWIGSILWWLGFVGKLENFIVF